MLIHANVGKFYAGTIIHLEIEVLQDLADGLVVRMPSEEDWRNEVIGEWLRKYLAGPANIAVEDRVRCFRLVEDLTASEYAGRLTRGRAHGHNALARRGEPQANGQARRRDKAIDHSSGAGGGQRQTQVTL